MGRATEFRADVRFGYLRPKPVATKLLIVPRLTSWRASLGWSSDDTSFDIRRWLIACDDCNIKHAIAECGGFHLVKHGPILVIPAARGKMIRLEGHVRQKPTWADAGQGGASDPRQTFRKFLRGYCPDNWASPRSLATVLLPRLSVRLGFGVAGSHTRISICPIPLLLESRMRHSHLVGGAARLPPIPIAIRKRTAREQAATILLPNCLTREGMGRGLCGSDRRGRPNK
jgi:hypothetical protein